MGKLKIIQLAIIYILMSGCGNNNQESAQDVLVRTVEQLNEKLNIAKKGENELIEKNAISAAEEFLSKEDIVANNWVAKVKSVRKSDENVIISADYKTISYELRIIDKELYDWAKSLVKDDKIIFSGSIGKEQSVTTLGGLSNPEYKFAPTAIRKADEPHMREQSKEAFDEYERLTKESERREILKKYVQTACEQRIRDKATIKSSVDFSIWRMSIKQTSDDTWQYNNAVELTNAFGTKIIYRAACIVKTRVSPKGILQAKIEHVGLFQ